jgi:hypothetical protein
MCARPTRRATSAAAFLLLCICLAPAARGEEPAAPDEATQAAALLLEFKDKDPSARVKALERARDNQHESLLPALTRLLSDAELGVRIAAIEALTRRADAGARRKAAVSLAARLGRLSKGRADRDEVMALIASLGTLREASGIKALLDPIEVEMDMDEVKARLHAVASIPRAEAVEALIDFLALGRRSGRGKHRAEAHDALRYLTGAQPSEYATAGHDADRWRSWWKDNKKSVDLEAVAAARDQAAAEKSAREEEKKKKAEERKKQQEERKKKAGKQPAPGSPPVID